MSFYLSRSYLRIGRLPKVIHRLKVNYRLKVKVLRSKFHVCPQVLSILNVCLLNRFIHWATTSSTYVVKNVNLVEWSVLILTNYMRSGF